VFAGALTQKFPGSQHIGLAGLHRQFDEAVREYARLQGFIIASKAKDFRQQRFLKGAPLKVIWLSVGNGGTDAIRRLLRDRHAGNAVSRLGNAHDTREHR
jgi:predicted nuclease of predicted toxin-antitoxin system